jgi:uncharacterized protein DUF1579
MNAGTLLLGSTLLLVSLGGAIVPRLQQKPESRASQDAPKVSQQELMARYMKLAQPGPHHERLKFLEGTWETTSRYTMAGAPPMEARGTTEYKPVLGGRFVQGEMSSQVMGMPVTVIHMSGYDNTKEKHVSYMFSSMSTAPVVCEGRCSGDCKEITLQGTEEDPGAGYKRDFEIRIRRTGADEFLVEVEFTGPDGKKAKEAETTYRRKKA